MSGQLTTYGRNRAVNAGVGDAESAVAGMYIALATSLPTGPQTATLAAYGSVEVTTSGYSRQAVTWNAASGGTVTSAGTLLFGPFTADPPEIGYAFECDTSTGTSGNVLAYWTLETARDAANGDYLQFSPGEVKMAVTET